MSRAIGIDLGTVNSCVASIVDGVPRVLLDAHGHNYIPSMFAIDASDEVIVGFAAQEQAHMNRENTIFAIKRMIGLKYESEEVQAVIRRLPFKVVKAPNGDAWVQVRGKAMSPIEVSSRILMYAKQVAEQALGEKVARAVITCPAHFNDAQRQATRDAGRIAGFDVMGIINEPTAAALAYGIEATGKTEASNPSATNRKERVVAVFDLGGGTFDISILRLSSGRFDVLSTSGDTYLGGEDFDMMILNYIIEYAKNNLGTDLTKDSMALHRIGKAAKQAKHVLSDNLNTVLSLPYIASGMRGINLPMTRRFFEELVEPVLKRLDKPCQNAMEDAELTTKQISDVVLVGGMTRMPAVKKRCQKIFGCIPHDDIDPDTAVAIGAAVFSGIVDGNVGDLSLQDVIPLSLGLEIQGGQVYRLIPRNTPIPTEVTRVFTTSAPNQSQVSIHILQGESKFAPRNTSLGRFELAEIGSAPRGEPEIAVTFAVDSGGIVHVSAQDLDSGEQKEVDIAPSSGLSEEAVDALIKQRLMEEEQKNRAGVLELKPSSSDKTPLVMLKDHLKNLLYMTQFSLDSQGQEFVGTQREALEQTLKKARLSVDGGSTKEEIEEAMRLLEQQAERFTSFLEDRL